MAEHLARQFRQHHPRVMFYVENKETDFVVLKNDRKLVGIEVKWRNNVDIKDFPNRHRFREKILVSKKDLQIIKEKHPNNTSTTISPIAQNTPNIQLHPTSLDTTSLQAPFKIARYTPTLSV